VILIFDLPSAFVAKAATKTIFQIAADPVMVGLANNLFS
jgi:hypothetical protein